MASKNDKHVSGDYVVSMNDTGMAFIHVLGILKSWKVGQNRILYVLLNSTTIRPGSSGWSYICCISASLEDINCLGEEREKTAIDRGLPIYMLDSY